MGTPCLQALRLCLFAVTMVLALTGQAGAQNSEHFSPASLAAAAGTAATVLNFDGMPPHNNTQTMVLDATAGITAVNRAGFGLNIVQRTGAPYGANFVTQGQIASPPNVLSSGHLTTGASPAIADDIDLIFGSPVRAAGLWIGSVGGGGSVTCENNPTRVEFLDAANGVIASEKLDSLHPAVIFGSTGFRWDNKIFYGIVSTTPIHKIRTFNSATDGCDVISIDDLQFVPIPLTLPPVASAGTDFSVNEGQSSVTLNGTGSHDPDGDALTYSWVQLPGGTAVSLFAATSAQSSFTAPHVAVGGETLTFQLSVTAAGETSTDTVSVTVVNVNHTPVADAGVDRSVAEGSPVILHGEASFDADGDGFTYTWMQVGGTPTVTLSAADTTTPTFVAPTLGTNGAPGVVATLIFELRVDDGFDADAPAPGFTLENVADRVTIHITNINNSPAADAGVDQTVDETSAVSLSAGGSSDPDSDLLTYSWSQIAGPAVLLEAQGTSAPTFSAPYVPAGGADLIFEATVNDGYGGLSSDTMVVHVQNVNDPPLANAARPTIAVLWPPNHGLVKIGILGVTDPNNNAMITITSVTQDEPTNGLGDGDTAVDAVINADGTVLLRAERSGAGDGRVYRVIFTASDPEGSSFGEVRVSVPHSVKKPAIDSGQSFDSTQ